MKIILNWGIKTNAIKLLSNILITIKKILGKKIKTICFYPCKPISYDILYWICFLNGYKISTDLSDPADIYMYWEDDTFHKSLNSEIGNHDWINLNCTDISKTKISSVFSKIFRYHLQVNPLEYNGYCVQKNDLNAKHDGKIIQCPIENIEPGSVYQKLIDNQKDDKYIVDIRVPIFKEYIPFVYLKYRDINTRFLNSNNYVEVKSTTEIFDNTEITQIIDFCKCLKMEYGELDVLRDNQDKKIYIVDANHCPSGPPNHLPLLLKWKYLSELAKSFDEIFGC
jgi:hypothetical protein